MQYNSRHREERQDSISRNVGDLVLDLGSASDTVGGLDDNQRRAEVRRPRSEKNRRQRDVNK
jgi:hypothetical protein